MKKTHFLLSTIVAGLALLATLQTSFSQVVKFNSSGSHAVYTPCDGGTKGIGNASYMGDVISYGIVVPIPTKNPLVFDWEALNFALVDAKGNQIFFAGSGSVEFMPIKGSQGMFTAFWTADFEVVGGTGRFKNVRPGDAPIQVFAINDPLSLPFVCPDAVWSYSWAMEGTIDMGRRELDIRKKVILGDADGDGVLSNLDAASFVLALTNPVAYQAMFPDVDPDVTLDMNGDGMFDNLDIAGFVAALKG